MCLFLPFGSLGQCPDDGILKLSRLMQHLNIPSCSDLFSDSTYRITFDSLNQNPQKYVFKPTGSNVNFEQPMGAAYWLRFKVRNEDSIPLYRMLSIYKKEVEYIQLFVEDGLGNIDSFPMIGSAMPYSKNLYPSNSPIFPVNFAAQKTYTLYLYLDYHHLPLSTPIFINTTFDALPITIFQKTGFFTGLATTYACLALIMFLFNRTMLYWGYFVYTLGGTGYLASTGTMGYAFIWSEWHIFSSISDETMGAVALIGFLLMTIAYFDTPQYFKSFDKILKSTIGITCLVILTGLLRTLLPLGTHYYMTLLWAISVVIGILTVLATIIGAYIKFKRPDILLFLLGFSSLLATIVCVFLTDMGFEQFRQIAHNVLPYFTVFFEFSIMLLVLIARLKDEWTSKQIKELELQQNLSEQRQRISRDLHDDVGSTLNSISVFSEIAKQQLKFSNPESLPLLDRIGDSSRELVSTINDIVWAINPQNDKFENIALRMRLFAADLLMPKDVDLDFQADTQLNDVNLSLEQRKQFYLIFKESINNVFKSAECSTLNVHLELCDTDVCMTIIDNGKGFDSANPKQGNGLKSMAERTKILRGVLEINSELGKGTALKLRFPIG